mmetsp:Transcript_17492/g.42697  ORF Transcript_17492/g.42697 Transcript_17492/m.42697 type:complete len:222 (+) Transcript_17492:229-894(+)
MRYSILETSALPRCWCLRNSCLAMASICPLVSGLLLATRSAALYNASTCFCSPECGRWDMPPCSPLRIHRHQPRRVPSQGPTPGHVSAATRGSRARGSPRAAARQQRGTSPAPCFGRQGLPGLANSAGTGLVSLVPALSHDLSTPSGGLANSAGHRPEPLRPAPSSAARRLSASPSRLDGLEHAQGHVASPVSSFSSAPQHSLTRPRRRHQAASNSCAGES